MTIRKAIVAVLAILALCVPCYAVPSIDGRPGPKEYVRPIHKQLAMVNGVSKVINPATGIRNVAVILIQFSVAGTASNPDGNDYLLSSGDITKFNTTFGYVKNFYNEASYGQLTLNFTFFTASSSKTVLSGTETPYTLTGTESFYGADDSRGQESLIKDSLALVGSSVTAVSAGGLFDAVLIAHAGIGEESNTGNKSDIWSAMTGLYDSLGNPIKVNGFSDGAVFPAREKNPASPVGVTCHEFGHILGLPDLYNTDTGNPSVGSWCLMDQGAWVGNGATPGPPSIWCRALEGWVAPISMSSQQELTGITQFETTKNSVYQIPILNSSSEYFLVCYSSKSTFNVSPPGQGFLIWHIDEGTINNETFVYRLEHNDINSLASHNTVALVTASNILTSVSPYGTANDPWPSVIKSVFTTPDSDSYTGQKSGIVISNFSLGSLNLSANKMADTVGIAGLFNYPNPAGAGYASIRAGIITTFAMQYTRPPKTMSLNIYSISGEHVKSAATSDFSQLTKANADYKWVYQYDWDGRNDSGDSVAPGVYIYRVTGDDATKVGKMAVVR